MKQSLIAHTEPLTPQTLAPRFHHVYPRPYNLVHRSTMAQKVCHRNLSHLHMDAPQAVSSPRDGNRAPGVPMMLAVPLPHQSRHQTPPPPPPHKQYPVPHGHTAQPPVALSGPPAPPFYGLPAPSSFMSQPMCLPTDLHPSELPPGLRHVPHQSSAPSLGSRPTMEPLPPPQPQMPTFPTSVVSFGRNAFTSAVRGNIFPLRS